MKLKTEILIRRMQDGGIKQNCQDYGQYIKAKRLVEDLASSPGEYEELIRLVINFVKI